MQKQPRSGHVGMSGVVGCGTAVSQFCNMVLLTWFNASLRSTLCQNTNNNPSRMRLKTEVPLAFGVWRGSVLCMRGALFSPTLRRQYCPCFSHAQYSLPSCRIITMRKSLLVYFLRWQRFLHDRPRHSYMIQQGRTKSGRGGGGGSKIR